MKGLRVFVLAARRPLGNHRTRTTEVGRQDQPDLRRDETANAEPLVAIVYVWSADYSRRERFPVRGRRSAKASWTVPDSVSYLTAYFVSRDASDASVSSMVWNREGKRMASVDVLH